MRSIGGQVFADERHARRARDSTLRIELPVAAAHQRQVPLARHDVEPERRVPAIIRNARLVETPWLRCLRDAVLHRVTRVARELALDHQALAAWAVVQVERE